MSRKVMGMTPKQTFGKTKLNINYKLIVTRLSDESARLNNN